MTVSHYESQRRWRLKNRERYNELQREYRQRNRAKVYARYRAKVEHRREVLEVVKRTAGCADCGTTEGRLDFDHTDPATKVTKLADMLSWGWPRIWAEVAKCEVRCAPCHGMRHWLQQAGAQ